MTKEEAKELYQNVVETVGNAAQIEMVIEECSELIHALQKFKRASNDASIENVCDELADVEIMIEQMRCVFNSDTIEERKDYKLHRLAQRLEKWQTTSK
jgi:NTP pyrophosphatase (non-canonical NTP hydrolase)